MVSLENGHMSNILQFCRQNICVCVLTINDKGIHKFKRSQGGIFGRIWRQENDGENAVIIL